MQSQTIPKETFIIVIFWGMIRGYDSGVWFGGMIRGYDSGVWFGVWFGGMIRGYDSHKSNFLPLLKTARVKIKHSHIILLYHKKNDVYYGDDNYCNLFLVWRKSNPSDLTKRPTAVLLLWTPGFAPKPFAGPRLRTCCWELTSNYPLVN